LILKFACELDVSFISRYFVATGLGWLGVSIVRETQLSSFSVTGGIALAGFSRLGNDTVACVTVYLNLCRVLGGMAGQ
jgi:hypothetical protein